MIFFCWKRKKRKALLSGLIKTVSECFSGGIVHLGMDEAAHLGRGKYMDLHGPEKGAKLMKSIWSGSWKNAKKRAGGDDLVRHVFAAEFWCGGLLWD